MSASTNSNYSLNFKVLSDTFGEVKFKEQHPGYEDDEPDFEIDPQTRQNTVANVNPYVNDVNNDVDDATSLENYTDNVDSPVAANPLRWTASDASNVPNVLRATAGGSFDVVVGDGGVSNPGFVTGEAESSSNHSSIAELSAAQERGLRTSFRNQPTELQADAKEEDETPVKVAEVFVRGVPGDIENETPASTASSTARFFLNSGNQHREFNVANLQQNYGATTREKIRQEYKNQADDDALTAPQLTQPNSVTVVTGAEDFPYNYEKENKFHPEKKTHCCPKVTTFLLALLLIIGGVVAATLLLKEDYPDKQTGQVHKETIGEPKKDICNTLDVKLRDVIRLSCLVRGNNRVMYIIPSKLRIMPPSYVNEGQPLLLGLDRGARNLAQNSNGNGQWNASFDVTLQELTIQGPPALCSSTGTYDLQFLDGRDSAIYNTSIKINVLSEVLKVNVSLSQSVADNSSEFTVACQTNSGCEQSFVDFFAEINKEEQYLRGVNFTCTIDYNDYDGYSVSCSGVIPDYLMSQFGRITCRPRSKLLDDLTEEELEDLEEILELPECDLSKHCGFTCENMGDYFKVNPGRCDIFHRCYQKQVYTSYCAPGTFFDPTECACRHTRDLAWCQDNGAVKTNADVSDVTCSTQADDTVR